MRSIWDESLALGQLEIDGEHAEAFVAFSRLLEAVAAGDRDRSATLLDDVGSKIARNFETEEKLMKDSAYPGAASHVEGHRLFQADFEQLRDDFRRRGLHPVFQIWIRSRLVNWFRFHIGMHDWPLVKHLRRTRPAAPPPDLAPEAVAQATEAEAANGHRAA